MKIGVLTAPLGDRDRKAAFATVRELGYEAVELGAGEFTTDLHLGLERMDDDAAVEELRSDLAAAGLELSSLSCHGNPLHPNADYAARADGVTRATIRLASKLGVDAINLFSGCPGTPDGGDYPNWVVHPWPLYFGDLLEWQWRERVIPYWVDLSEYAAGQGVRLAIEAHPSNVVYTTDSLLRLRAQCGGETVGANFDPSHFWWQGIDPIVSVRAIAAAGALFNVHVKDTVLDRAEIARTGVLAIPAEGARAPWRFGTVGHGHGARFWCAFFDELGALGYDGVLSVEHEDELAPVEEALARTFEFLRACVWRDSASAAAWLEGHDPPYPNPDNPWSDPLPGDTPQRGDK
jgi:sugar phosphate isomerase/epimerase